MSVLRIGGVRMAAGLEWERGLVAGAAARRIARQRRRPLAVDVVGQTGFLDEAEGAEGTKPLAGVLARLLQGRLEAEDWVAFVEEDADAGPERRLVVVRSYGGVLLPDGDTVHESLEQAFEALGSAGGENVLVVATEGLAERFTGELSLKVDELIDVQAIVRASDEVDALVAVPTSGWSRKRIARVAAVVAVTTVGWAAWSNQAELKRWVWGEEPEKERPKVKVVVETERFLSYCRDELARQELRLAGFDRVAVFCHSSFRLKSGSGLPKKYKGRAVLEVRWVLRDGLRPRVYGRVAEQLLVQWEWAVVKDTGQAVALSPLPQVLARAGKRRRESTPLFRARVDGMFSLRGFSVEYDWKKKKANPEVVLTTERPFAQAVSMITGLGGLEVLSAGFEKGLWRFEAQRPKPRSMFEDRFMKLEKLARPVASARGKREVAA